MIVIRTSKKLEKQTDLYNVEIFTGDASGSGMKLESAGLLSLPAEHWIAFRSALHKGARRPLVVLSEEE